MRIPPTGVGKTRHAEDERPQQCGHSQHQEDAPEQHQVVMLVQQKETHGNEQTEEDRVDHGLSSCQRKERPFPAPIAESGETHSLPERPQIRSLGGIPTAFYRKYANERQTG